MKVKPSILIFLFIAFSFFESNLIAQELITDRPDITESAIAMYPGYLQIEDGFVFENQKTSLNGQSGKILGYTISDILFRYGLPGNIELRAGGNYLYQKTEQYNLSAKEYGINDFMLGAKYQFCSEELNDVDFGMLVQFHMPIGDAYFRSKSVEPEILAALGISLLKNLSVSANIGGHKDSNNDEVFYLYSVSFGIEISETFEGFIEIYGDFAKDGPLNKKFDSGLTYQLGNNFQVDCSAGTDSFASFNDWFIGTGFSIRFPK